MTNKKMKAMRIMLFITVIFSFCSCKTIHKDICGFYYGNDKSFTQLTLSKNKTFDYLEEAQPVFIPSKGKWNVNNDTVYLKSDSSFVLLYLHIQRIKEGDKAIYTLSLSDNEKGNVLLPITNFSLIKDRKDTVTSSESFSKYSTFISIDNSIDFDSVKIAPILYPTITVGKGQMKQDTLLSVDVLSPKPYFVNRRFLIIDNKLVEIEETLSQRRKLEFYRKNRS